MWVNLSYDFDLKDHVVCQELVGMVRDSVLQKYAKVPSSEKKVDTFFFDPGGMILLRNQPTKTNWEQHNIEVRPELILNAIVYWNYAKKTEDLAPNGEAIYRVYLPFQVIILTASLYQRIGAWLMSQKTSGYLARMEIVEMLSGAEDLVIFPPPTEGEA